MPHPRPVRRVAPIAWDYLCEEIQVALDTTPKRDTPVLAAVDPTPDEAEAEEAIA